MSRVVLISFLGMCLGAPVAGAGDEALSFDAGWELPDKGAALESYLGHDALRVDTGRVFYRELALQDGSIEFDIALPGHRAFAYLQFRMATDEDHEEIYFRPHKSELPDALQYTPVFRRVSQWQLFHGPGGTAAVALPADQWIHVRVVMRGRQAAVYVGDVEEPQLVIPRLAHEPRAGYIALRGFLPRGTPTSHAAYFANVVVNDSEPTLELKTEPTPALKGGTLTRWELSPGFRVEEGRVVEVPDLTATDWIDATAEPRGFVMLDRWLSRPEGRGITATVARVKVQAEDAARRRFEFGFSDWVSVFLNGELLFTGAAPYSPDRPRRDGLLTPDDYSLLLPLQAGENELLLIVSDVFGGWGFHARLVE